MNGAKIMTANKPHHEHRGNLNENSHPSAANSNFNQERPLACRNKAMASPIGKANISRVHILCQTLICVISPM